MPYIPTPSMTGSDVTDNAGGTVSRTIVAAGATYSQSTENRERSSLADMLQALRSAFAAMTGVRGGGCRRIPTVTALNLVNITPTGTTIASAPIGTHDKTNEDTYRANLATAINDFIATINAAGFVTGPRASVTRITDSSGGTSGPTVSASGTTYSNIGENNTRAVLSTKLNEVADAIGA